MTQHKRETHAISIMKQNYKTGITTAINTYAQRVISNR